MTYPIIYARLLEVPMADRPGYVGTFIASYRDEVDELEAWIISSSPADVPDTVLDAVTVAISERRDKIDELNRIASTFIRRRAIEGDDE